MAGDTRSMHASTTVAVTGATGLIGSALVARLRDHGHRVRRLVRSPNGAGADDVVWDPDRGLLDPRSLEGVAAVVHLAGAPIARRWTPARKREIRDSRVRGTDLLARCIASLDRKPAVLLSGSAIGFYGDRGAERLDERSSAGADFLAGVVREWEGAATPAAQAGVRVAYLRTGIVLAAHGGALAKLLTPFRLGLGGRIADGKQWMSWIALEDELRAIEFALVSEAVSGAVNLVAPNPVTNGEFAATLGRVLARPAVMPVPAAALRFLYGEMADATILSSQRVAPRALIAAQFDFAYPTLEQALRKELGR